MAEAARVEVAAEAVEVTVVVAEVAVAEDIVAVVGVAAVAAAAVAEEEDRIKQRSNLIEYLVIFPTNFHNRRRLFLSGNSLIFYIR